MKDYIFFTIINDSKLCLWHLTYNQKKRQLSEAQLIAPS